MRRVVQYRVSWFRSRTKGGKTYAQIRGPHPATGRRVALETLGYVTEEEAEERLSDWLAAQRLGVSLPSDAVVRVEDVVDFYLDALEMRPVSAGHKKMELHRGVNVTRHLAHLPADSVTQGVLTRYQGDRKREKTRFGTAPKSSTIREEVAMLRRCYRHAREERLIDYEPPGLPRGKMADDSRPARRLTEGDVRELVTAAHSLDVPWWGHYLTVLAWSGRRPVAIQALERRDLRRLFSDLPRSEQLVYWSKDKGGVGRGWGPVPEPARQALLRWGEHVESGPLWLTHKGLPASTQRVAYLWRKTKALCSIEDVQPYDCRRFACVRIVRGLDGDLDSAIRYTGHKSVKTLLRYTYAERERAESRAKDIGWSTPALAEAQ